TAIDSPRLTANDHAGQRSGAWCREEQRVAIGNGMSAETLGCGRVSQGHPASNGRLIHAANGAEPDTVRGSRHLSESELRRRTGTAANQCQHHGGQQRHGEQSAETEAVLIHQAPPNRRSKMSGMPFLLASTKARLSELRATPAEASHAAQSSGTTPAKSGLLSKPKNAAANAITVVSRLEKIRRIRSIMLPPLVSVSAAVCRARP